MTNPTATAPRPPVSSPLIGAVLAGAVVYGCWWFFVTTPRGQRLDELALAGSTIGAARLDAQFQQLLGTISVPAVAVMIGVSVGIALLRRQRLLAVVATAVIVAANLTTQVLKYLVFAREDLVRVSGAADTNSLPSGHTTVAAAGVLGLLLFVPPALRAITATLGAAAITAFGYATLVNQWHRPSDVIASVAVCLAWTMAGIAVLRGAQAGLVPAEHSHRPGALSVLLVTAAIIALGLAGAAAGLLWEVDPVAAERTERLIAYAGGVAALAAVTSAGLGTVLRLLDATRPEPAARPAAVTPPAAGGPRG